ncbi:flagellin N-terminal helical domain-containing protein, partial [Bacillus thuringiensis]|uniref:flagellin N-terminal helical domain-containing protein n=1 Tax=Bacillus thuringiensis TaxID=1428 RepID=UPI002DC031E4
MRINTNINSMRTQEYMRQNQAKMSNAMDRLSSGKRINNASDDAAGLAIATRMRARESGLGVAANNTQDGMSLIRTADSAMNSVSNILLRMRDISNQSANGTNTDKNQSALDKEFAALKDQIDYISKNTEFNDQKLLDGSKKSIAIQTLDNADTNKQIDIQLSNVSTKELKLDTLSIEGSSSKTFTITADDMLAVGTANATAKAKAGTLKGLNVTTGDLTAAKTDVQDFRAAFDKVKGFMGSTEVTNIEKALTKFDGDQSLANAKAIGDALTSDLATTIAKDQTYSKNVSNASSAIASIDAALESIASNRATLGATLNRLDFNVNNLKSQSSSMASAASQIEDADMAKEMYEV